MKSTSTCAVLLDGAYVGLVFDTTERRFLSLESLFRPFVDVSKISSVDVMETSPAGEGHVLGEDSLCSSVGSLCHSNSRLDTDVRLDCHVMTGFCPSHASSCPLEGEAERESEDRPVANKILTFCMRKVAPVSPESRSRQQPKRSTKLPRSVAGGWGPQCPYVSLFFSLLGTLLATSESLCVVTSGHTVELVLRFLLQSVATSHSVAKKVVVGAFDVDSESPVCDCVSVHGTVLYRVVFPKSAVLREDSMVMPGQPSGGGGRSMSMPSPTEPATSTTTTSLPSGDRLLLNPSWDGSMSTEQLSSLSDPPGSRQSGVRGSCGSRATDGVLFGSRRSVTGSTAAITSTGSPLQPGTQIQSFSRMIPTQSPALKLESVSAYAHAPVGAVAPPKARAMLSSGSGSGSFIPDVQPDVQQSADGVNDSDESDLVLPMDVYVRQLMNLCEPFGLLDTEHETHHKDARAQHPAQLSDVRCEELFDAGGDLVHTNHRFGGGDGSRPAVTALHAQLQGPSLLPPSGRASTSVATPPEPVDQPRGVVQVLRTRPPEFEVYHYRNRVGDVDPDIEWPPSVTAHDPDLDGLLEFVSQASDAVTGRRLNPAVWMCGIMSRFGTVVSGRGCGAAKYVAASGATLFVVYSLPPSVVSLDSSIVLLPDGRYPVVPSNAFRMQLRSKDRLCLSLATHAFNLAAGRGVVAAPLSVIAGRVGKKDLWRRGSAASREGDVHVGRIQSAAVVYVYHAAFQTAQTLRMSSTSCNP